MKKLFALLILLSFFYNHAQTGKRVDSLISISKEQTDLHLINTLKEIAWEYKNSNMDSSFYYARQALQISKNIDSKKAIASSYNSLASCFVNIGELDSALVYHNKSLSINLQMDEKESIADTYNNLGIVYDSKGDYVTSLENYFKALNIYETVDASENKLPQMFINIGITYKKQKDYDKSLQYYKKALEIYKQNNYPFGIAIATGNLGSLLLCLKAYDSSIVYSQKSRKQYKALGYLRYEPYLLNNIAVAKDSMKLTVEAQTLYKKAIVMYIKDGNLYEVANSKLGLAKSYITDFKYNLAIEKSNDALKISINKGFKEFEVSAYRILAMAHAGKGNHKEAYSYSIKYAKGNDELFEDSKTKAVFELDKKYQTEKKEKEILSQRADIAEKELNLNRKNTQLIGLVILACVLSLLGYLVYSKQKLKNLQLKKESELKEALIKIESQNELQEQRIRISRDLHDNIGAQLTFIISSIENLQYGFKITNDKLTNKLTSISEFTKETIYELRDTIWAMNKSQITLEDLQARISNFIDKANSVSTKVNFEFNIDSNLSDTQAFTSVTGMNVYRIIQEAINNALKYADASMIHVDIKKSNNKIQFSVKDNGIGFNEKDIVLGNGVINMKKRAQDIGAVLKVESEINKGTSILLKV
jgi:signal transduction histidine kinase